MNIKEYIKDLLFTNQGVIIPGFGGFVSEYEPAAFDVNENKFLPPSKKISFKSDYNFSDNLLTEYISEKENMDLSEAKKVLDEFVNEIKSGLTKGEKIVFPEIGTLSKSVKGIIQFSQDKQSNLLTDSFGLHSIKTAPVIREQKPVIAPQKQKRSYRKPIIIGSSALVFIILLALSWFLTNGYTNFNFISDNTEIQTAKPVITTNNSERNLDSIAKADSLKAVINQSIDEKTDLKDALYYEEPPKEDPKPQYSSYKIIAGSFKSMENAEKFSSELKAKGYNPEIIQSDEDLIRIAIFTYNDETEALKKLYKLRQESDIKSVWILKSI